jgi:hypothetical protein
MRAVGIAALALAVLAALLLLRPAPAPSRPPPPTATPSPGPRAAAAPAPIEAAEPAPAPAKPAVTPVERLLAAIRSRDLKEIAQANAALYASLVPEPIPDDENAAVLYKRAFEKLVKPTDAEREAIDPVEDAKPPTPEQRAILQVYLEKNKEALALLHEAAGRARCDFGVAYNEGFEALMPHVSPMIQASKLLRAEGALAEEGDLPGVAAAALRAADALSGEPFLVSQLVRGVNVAIASETLQRALGGSGDTASLAAMIDSLSPEKGRAGMERSLLFELWTSVQFYLSGRDLASLQSQLEGNSPGKPARPWSDEPDSALDLEYYAETMAEYSGLLRRPYYESREAIDRLMKLRVEGAPAYATFSRLTMPSFGRAASRYAHSEATVGMAQVAVALDRYRAANGAYPGTLAALGSSPRLIDPFTGRAYGYRPEGAGFVLYSVGEDGVDNGGLSGTSDILFHVR